eukprot:4772387-Amphidinium_carterae.1
MPMQPDDVTTVDSHKQHLLSRSTLACTLRIVTIFSLSVLNSTSIHLASVSGRFDHPEESDHSLHNSPCNIVDVRALASFTLVLSPALSFALPSALPLPFPLAPFPPDRIARHLQEGILLPAPHPLLLTGLTERICLLWRLQTLTKYSSDPQWAHALRIKGCPS